MTERHQGQHHATPGGGDPLASALERVVAGDRAAFAEVYRQSAPKLFGICLRMCKERTEAEEVLQETFLTIWRRAHLFDRNRGGALTWLVVIARNRALDRLRATGRVPDGPIDLADQVSDPAPSALAIAEGDQERRRLALCLAELDAGDAAMIRAGFFDDTPYSALARRTGLPLGTVKSRIRRALLKLRACLQ